MAKKKTMKLYREDGSVQEYTVNDTSNMNFSTNKNTLNTLKKIKNKSENEFDTANEMWKNKVKENRPDKTKQMLTYQDKNDNRTIKTEDIRQNKKTGLDLVDDTNNAFESASEEYKKKEEARNKYALADYLYNKEKYSNGNYNPGFIQSVYDKSIGRGLRGAGEMLLNLGGRDNEKYVDEKGNVIYLPSELELKNQAVRKTYGKNFAGKLAAGLGDVTENVGKIGTATALDAVTFGVGGTLAYNNDIAQRAYKNAINEGANQNNALANAGIGTASEILTGKLLGSATKGLTKFGGNTLAETEAGSAFENFLQKQIGKKVSNKTFAKILAASGSEATEEGIQEYIDALNDKLTLGKNINLKDTTKNAGYSALIGGLTGGVINTPGAIRNNRIDTQNIDNEIYTKNNLLTNLDDQAKIIQEEYQKGNISPVEANEQIQTLMSEQKNIDNSNKVNNSPYNISDSLKNEIMNKTIKNMEKNNDVVMVPIEEILPYKNNDGGYRTEKQVNDLLSDIKNDGIINPIELSKNNDGSYSIEQGNHRLQIAKELGLKEIPIKIVNEKLENINNQSYNNSIGGVDDGQINSNREVFDRYYERSGDIQGNNNNSSNEFDTGISKNRNDRLRGTMEEYNNRPSGDAAYGKNHSTKQELDNSSFSNDKNNILYANKESNDNILRINDDGTSEITDGKPKILDKTPMKEKQTLKDKIVQAKNETRRALFDKGQEVYDIAKKTKNKTLYHKYDNIGTAHGEAQHQIGEAQTNLLGKKYKNFTDADGNKTAMSVESIWKDANDSGISDKTLNEYLVNQLNIDRINQGVEQFTNMDSDYSQEIIDKLEKENPNIKRVAENIWQYNKNQLQKMVDGGLISQEMADSFMETTPHYVRIQRNTGKSNNSIKIKNGKVEINNQIQKVKGSSLDIMPIKETMAQYTQDVTNSIRKNIFGKELAKTLGMGSQDTTISAVDESFGINPELLGKDANGNYTFTIFDNGTATVLPINEGIYEALNTQKSPLEKKINKLGTPLRKISSMQRTLLTDKNPLFLATNFFKDIGDAPFNSKYGMGNFYKNYIKLFGGRTIGNLTRKGNITNSNKVNVSDYVNLYESLGGNQNSYFNQGEFESNKGKVSKAVDKILTPIEKGNEFIESMPRITEFVTTIEQNGYTLNSDGDLVVKNNKKATKSADEVLSEAMYNAAEITTNFKRGGDISKMVNKNGGTFFNASMQGFSKFTRNFTEIENPKQAVKLLAKVTMLGVAPAMLGEAMYGDDDEYKDLPDYVKDEYYLFKDEKGNWEDKNGSKWLRIPKGRMMSIFGAAARRTKNFSSGDKDAFKGFGEIATNQIAPNNPFEDNVLSPLVSVANNKSWSGNNIESDYLQSLPKKERFDARTSEFSKWLGKKLNYSPKKLDYLLDQYTGGIGDVALPAMTNYAESDDDSALGRLIKNPVKNKFTTDSTLNNKTVNQYYDLMDKIEQKGNSSKSTALDRAKAKYVGSFSDAQSKLSELYKEQRNIQNNKKMSDKEKYSKNKAKQKEIINTMKQTMDELKNAYDNGDTIKIGDKNYAEVKEDGKTKIKSYSMAKVNEANELGIDVSEYAKINSKINSIKANKNEYGRAISGSKKQKVFEYINSLDLSSEQKLSIYRSYYKKG